MVKALFVCNLLYDVVHRLSTRSSLSSTYLELSLLGPSHLKIANPSHSMSWDDFSGASQSSSPRLCLPTPSWGLPGLSGLVVSSGPPRTSVGTCYCHLIFRPPTNPAPVLILSCKDEGMLSPSVGLPRYWQTCSSISHPGVEVIFSLI